MNLARDEVGGCKCGVIRRTSVENSMSVMEPINQTVQQQQQAAESISAADRTVTASEIGGEE